MNLIVSVDENWAIGSNGKLLFHAPADMHLFREKTLGKTVILGRKTLATFPNGMPLADRHNIILTRSSAFSCPGADIVHDLPTLFKLLRDVDPDSVWVIGGASVYQMLLPYCNIASVTRFLAAAPEPDAFFPDLSADPSWLLRSSSVVQTHKELEFRFETYENRAPLGLY